MSSSTRYFQLTPDILVEYNYNKLSNAEEQSGTSDRIFDLMDNNPSLITNGYCATKSFYWELNDDEYPYIDKNGNEHYLKNFKKNFVLPINKSESKFIQWTNGHTSLYEWNIDFGSYPVTEISESYTNSDILFDTFRLHFTSRNYLGNTGYDGFIVSAYVYDKLKNKVGLLSQYIKKTEDPIINENPTIINQKLYTTYIDFAVPNVNAIIQADTLSTILPGEKILKNTLFPEKYPIMDNSPIVMNIYGVKSTYTNGGYEYYNVEKLNSIYIPLVDKSNSLEVKIKEADDGDYFEIYPEVNNGTTSFSDYIYKISDGRPELYIIFHELNLIENFSVNYSPNPIKETTHREQYIINATYKYSDNGIEKSNVNEDELDSKMLYRPILKHSAKDTWFTIEVKTNIINTLDNTTTVIKGTFDYGNPEDVNSSNQNPKKYGKRMNRIYLGDIPAQVNVYNKKHDIDRDGVRIVNSSSNVKIENHQHSFIGFIECTNVGVSIEQIPKELL